MVSSVSAQIQALIENKPIVFNCLAKRIDPQNRQAERILVVTQDHVYFFTEDSVLNRKFEIQGIKAIIRAQQSDEFVFVFARQTKDMRIGGLDAAQKLQLQQAVRDNFARISPERTLQIYEVPQQQLGEFTRANRNTPQYMLPRTNYRLTSEEIAGSQPEEEDDEESKMARSRPGQSNEENKKNVNTLCTDMKRTSSLIFKKNESLGDVDLGDFDITAIIGEGSFGRVYFAELEKNGQKQYFAIKAIRKDKLINDNSIQSALLEQRILYEADHPFLCGLNYFFQTDLRLYYVMPFIRGGEIFKVLEIHKRFVERDIKFYIAQLVLGVGYLHKRDIIHRDLKMENIMLDEQGYVKIIDYGLSRMLQPDELASTFCGTPEYFAPELIRPGGYGKDVDWWAIGILIFEMLCGSTPFCSSRQDRIFQKILNQDVTFLSHPKITYSPELEDIVM